MAMKLTFHGGAGKVTGSNFLIVGEKGKILVDCGMEQGKDFCEECVYGPFPYDASSIDALVITHAHLDHVGRVPKLVRDGFMGKIYMTPPTKDLSELIMNDSVRILAKEARYRGRPPLYEENDVKSTLELIETLDYHQDVEVAQGLTVRLMDAGHILGSAIVRITDTDGTVLALSGDLGNVPSPLLRDTEYVEDADALVMESVYGDRAHPPHAERVPHMRDVLRKAIAKGGAVLIPAFSIERTQLMLYELSNMFEAGELSKVPVYLDSPLAIHVTDIYEKWGSTYFKKEAEDEMRREGSLFTFPFLKKTLDHRDSERITSVPNPKIIIAGAGMSHGGRIGRWEARYLPDKATTLIMVGYQAPGSPGRRLLDGAKKIRMGGHEIRVRAHVETLNGWSAHADRDALLEFASHALPKAKVIFTALGEPSSASFLAQRIHDFLGGRAVMPQKGDTWEITKDMVRKV